MDKRITGFKDYEEIKRDRLCDRLIKQEKALSDQDVVRLHKLAILVQPLKEDNPAKYLKMEDIDFVMNKFKANVFVRQSN